MSESMLRRVQTADLSVSSMFGSPCSTLVGLDVPVDPLFCHRGDASRLSLAQLFSVVSEPLPQLVVQLLFRLETPLVGDALLVDACPLAV